MASTYGVNFDRLLGEIPYGVSQAEKESILLEALNDLTSRHFIGCTEYSRIIKGLWRGNSLATDIDKVPYLPVSIFKNQSLSSVPESDIRMTLTSSGTTGQAVSKIQVDAETSLRQQRALANSLRHVLGPHRLPMLVIDSRAVFKDPRLMSARGAGVLGIMRYGRDHAFTLDHKFNVDLDSVRDFLRRYSNQPFFMFGFTFMVWLEFYERFKEEGFDLSNGILIHSGGWKKMVDRAVSPEQFRGAFQSTFGLRKIFNFYGMVEQIGTIFLEGPEGLLYPPNFADVIIRDPRTWEPCGIGETGVVQLLSLVPTSYPGHSVLTEDLGRIEAIDSRSAGWMGKGIRILGRVPKAELRGCSDVMGDGSS